MAPSRSGRSLTVAACARVCADVIKLQLVEAGLVECLLDVVAQTVDGDREEDVSQLKTASDLMVLLLLGGRSSRARLREAFTLPHPLLPQTSPCRSCLKEAKAASSRGSSPGFHPITTSCSSPGP